MLIRFTKMHGLGNDFVVIDTLSQRLFLNESQIQRIADRHLGIGCDQLLLVEPPCSPETDFFYRVFNQNGKEVEQCGNGARCLARFVRDSGLSDKDNLNVETLSGLIQINFEPDGMISVNMGQPILKPEEVPFISLYTAHIYAITILGKVYQASVLSMGNPHCAFIFDDIRSAPVDTLGAALQAHARFPNNVNVEFIEIVERDHIRLRVFERGVGETSACGTGACAAVVAGRLRGLLDAEVRVDLPGGQLAIRWENEQSPVWMKGPAVSTFQGRFRL